MKLVGLICSIVVFAFTSSCGSSAPQPATADDTAAVTSGEGATTPAETAAAPGAAAPVGDVWSAAWTPEQKAEFMKQKVMPAMEPVFKDANLAEAFSCKTCHGPEFKLPKDFLPRLTVKDKQLTAFADDAETAKFMMEKVTPAMAAALGLPHYDPATNQGFGCGGCHAVDMK
jgi:cytochrome c553